MIKSFVEACKQLRLNPKTCLPKVSGMPVRDRKALLATARMYIITRALNGDWQPNWDDSNEYKYWPWFYMNKPGFRLLGIDYYWTYSATGTGSRLCFRTRELTEHAVKYFLHEYEAMMILPPKAKKPGKKPAKKAAAKK